MTVHTVERSDNFVPKALFRGGAGCGATGSSLQTTASLTTTTPMSNNRRTPLMSPSPETDHSPSPSHFPTLGPPPHSGVTTITSSPDHSDIAPTRLLPLPPLDEVPVLSTDQLDEWEHIEDTLCCPECENEWGRLSGTVMGIGTLKGKQEHLAACWAVGEIGLEDKVHVDLKASTPAYPSESLRSGFTLSGWLMSHSEGVFDHVLSSIIPMSYPFIDHTTVVYTSMPIEYARGWPGPAAWACSCVNTLPFSFFLSFFVKAQFNRIRLSFRCIQSLLSCWKKGFAGKECKAQLKARFGHGKVPSIRALQETLEDGWKNGSGFTPACPLLQRHQPLNLPKSSLLLAMR